MGKLIDLICKNFDTWPSKYEFIAQEPSGILYGYEIKPNWFEGLGTWVNEEPFHKGTEKLIASSVVAEDARHKVVSKVDFLNQKGLSLSWDPFKTFPPVGAEVMVFDEENGPATYRMGTVVYSGDKGATVDVGFLITSGEKGDFRPIEVRDVREKLIKECLREIVGDTDKVNKLYESLERKGLSNWFKFKEDK